MEPWEVAAARRVLGVIRVEELPQFAVSALQAGWDSVSLAALAGEPEHHIAPRDLWDLFARALVETGMRLPSKQEAVASLVQHYAEAGAAGRCRYSRQLRTLSTRCVTPWMPRITQAFGSCMERTWAGGRRRTRSFVLNVKLRLRRN